MASSTGGFWSSGFGQFLQGASAILGISPLIDQAVSREVTANQNDLNMLHDETMLSKSHANALQQMNLQYNLNSKQMAQQQALNKELIELQQNFEKNMSSTAYQRAVQDMKAAGLNIASLAGTSGFGAASTPSTSIPGTSGLGVSSSGSSSGGRSGSLGYSSSNALGSLASSAFNAILAKDKSAAEIAKQELVDNARHAHYMEEHAEDIAYTKIKRQLAQNEFLNQVAKDKGKFY